MTSPKKPHADDHDDGQPANQGPVPPEPEDTPDTGEGRLAPQPGGDELEAAEDDGE